jgi:hypothetical protein
MVMLVDEVSRLRKDSAHLDVLLDPDGPFIVYGRAKLQGSDKYVFVDYCVTSRTRIDEVLEREKSDARTR